MKQPTLPQNDHISSLAHAHQTKFSHSPTQADPRVGQSRSQIREASLRPNVKYFNDFKPAVHEAHSTKPFPLQTGFEQPGKDRNGSDSRHLKPLNMYDETQDYSARYPNFWHSKTNRMGHENNESGLAFQQQASTILNAVTERALKVLHDLFKQAELCLHEAAYTQAKYMGIQAPASSLKAIFGDPKQHVEQPDSTNEPNYEIVIPDDNDYAPENAVATREENIMKTSTHTSELPRREQSYPLPHSSKQGTTANLDRELLPSIPSMPGLSSQQQRSFSKSSSRLSTNSSLERGSLPSTASLERGSPPSTASLDRKENRLAGPSQSDLGLDDTRSQVVGKSYEFIASDNNNLSETLNIKDMGRATAAYQNRDSHSKNRIISCKRISPIHEEATQNTTYSPSSSVSSAHVSSSQTNSTLEREPPARVSKEESKNLNLPTGDTYRVMDWQKHGKNVQSASSSELFSNIPVVDGSQPLGNSNSRLESGQYHYPGVSGKHNISMPDSTQSQLPALVAARKQFRRQVSCKRNSVDTGRTSNGGSYPDSPSPSQNRDQVSLESSSDEQYSETASEGWSMQSWSSPPTADAQQRCIVKEDVQSHLYAAQDMPSKSQQFDKATESVCLLQRGSQELTESSELSIVTSAEITIERDGNGTVGMDMEDQQNSKLHFPNPEASPRYRIYVVPQLDGTSHCKQPIAYYDHPNFDRLPSTSRDVEEPYYGKPQRSPASQTIFNRSGELRNSTNSSSLGVRQELPMPPLDIDVAYKLNYDFHKRK